MYVTKPNAGPSKRWRVNRKITKKMRPKKKKKKKRPQLKQIYYFLMCSLLTVVQYTSAHTHRQSDISRFLKPISPLRSALLSLAVWCALVLIIWNNNNALLTYRTASKRAQCISVYLLFVVVFRAKSSFVSVQSRNHKAIRGSDYIQWIECQTSIQYNTRIHWN